MIWPGTLSAGSRRKPLKKEVIFVEKQELPKGLAKTAALFEKLSPDAKVKVEAYGLGLLHGERMAREKKDETKSA